MGNIKKVQFGTVDFHRDLVNMAHFRDINNTSQVHFGA